MLFGIYQNPPLSHYAIRWRRWLAVVLLITGGVHLTAADRTWDGGGGDDNWTTAANWDGDVTAPSAGDNLIFTGGTRLTPNNNFTADTSFGSITFSSGAGAFTLGGNRITLTGAITNNDNTSQTINLAMVIAATRTIDCASESISFGGVISGAGGLTKIGSFSATLNGANTYTGNTAIDAGVLNLTHSTAAGNGGTVTVANVAGARVNLLVNDLTVANPLVINGGSAVAQGALGFNNTNTGTWSGPITINAGTLAGGHFACNSGGTLVITGAITSAATQVHFRLGNISLPNAAGHSFADATVSAGTITLGADNVLPVGSTLTLGQNGASTLDLAGYHQTLTALTRHANANPASVTSSSGTPTLTLNISGTNDYAGTLSGSLALSHIGAGSLTLSGTQANTYTGTTTVTAGVLHLNKTAGVNAVAGALAINGGQVTFGANNQLADTCAVSMSGAASVFNGTGVNVGTLNAINETIASLTMTGGTFAMSNGSAWVITGAWSVTGGAGNTIVIGNSSSNLSTDSLSLTAMTGVVGGIINTSNSFTLYGNQATQSTLTVGAGGLTLNGSILNVRRGDPGMGGSRVVLNGPLTTAGTGASSIAEDTGGGVNGAIAVELASAAGAATRTITTATGANLTISIPITNGAATPGALIKAGPATLTLSGQGSYSGGTTLNNGDLVLAASGGAVTGPIGTGTITLDPGANTARILLQGGQNIANALVMTSVRPGSGNGALEHTGSGAATWSGSLTFNANTANGGHLHGGATIADVLVLTGALTTGGTLTRLDQRDGFVRYSGTPGTIPQVSVVGTAQWGVSGAFPATTAFFISPSGNSGQSGTLDLNGFDQTIGGLTFQGVSGGIVTTGVGTLTLNGDIASTFTGTLDPGVNTLSGNLNLGGATRTVNVANSSAAPDLTISAVISNGGLIKTGTGTLRLNGTNTYADGTVITAGALSYASDTVFSGTGAIQLNGGRLLHLGESTLANAVSVTASSTIESDDGDNLTFSSGTISATPGTVLSLVNTANTGDHSMVFSGSGFTYAGDITMDSNSRLSLGNTSGTQTFSGVIAGSGIGTNGAINRNAAGGMTILSGTNTYTGVTRINAGTLSIGDGTTDGSIATSSAITNNAALIYNLVGSRTYSNVISGSGTLTKSGAGTLTLTGTNTYTGATTISAGTLQIGNGTTDGSIATSSGITNNAALVYQVVGARSYANVISGSGTLTKSGTGTLTLSGTNTYTGTTTVGAGILSVTGSTAVGSAVTVSSGGTLTGTGTVAGTVAVANGGTLSPGVANGLTASFVATSLRAVTQDDWRLTQTITGTRTDQTINQPGNAFGSGAERSAFGISGFDNDWGDFSVQWDGYLRVATAGTTLSTRSDDGSRVWLDLNGNGSVDSGEWGSNGWSSGQGEITRAVHNNIPIGTYRMRVQYEEGNGGNAMYLLWNDATNTAGTVDSIYVVPSSLLVGGSAIGTLTTGAVTFNASSTYTVDLNGTTPTFDQVSTAGAVACAGTLTIGSITNAGVGKVYTIINAGSRSGAFSGLANGDYFKQQSRTFQIAYTGTTVTLTEVAHLTTRVWDGGGADNNWTTAANWDYDIAPIAGDDLQFAGTTRLAPNNDFTAETTFASITFNSGAGAFVIGPTTSSGSGMISREVWTGVGGSTVAAIPVGTAANITDTLTSLEAPTDWADNYGTRIRGFITAPTSGNYTFWVASDNNSELWLSTDVQLTNKVLIASVTDFTNSREWNKFGSQKSSPITLVAGQKYFIEVLQKEDGGGDNVAVGWAKPGEATVTPSEVIPGTYLSPYTGNYGITLAGNITNNSASLQTVNLGLYLAATRTVACTSGNVSLGGTISGGGGLTKSGANGLTLGGANTFTGGVSLNAGTLNLNHATALGTGTLSIAGGTTVDNTAGAAVTLTANNPQIWNGDFTFTGSNALHLGTGAVAMGAATRQVTVSASTLTLGGAIGGAGGLTKQGSGTLRLSGVCTYAGATDVVAGTLALGVQLFSGFGTTGTGWSLNAGSAVASDVLTLTTNAANQARSAFLTTRVPLGGFTTSFRYQASGNRAADGTVFVLHNDSRGASAVGGTGGNMAYGGITPSAAIALNIFTDNVRGTGYRTGGNQSIPFTSTAPVDLGNGNVIAVMLKYDGTNLLTQTLRDLTTGDTWSTTYTVGNLTTTAGGANAFIGFTAATGGQVSTQQISNFSFNVGSNNLLPTTTALSIAAGATVDLGGKDQQVASLANYGGGGGSVTNNGTEDSALTVNGSGSTTFAGVISDGGSNRVSLVKDGSSTLTLGGANVYSGTTTVSAGSVLVTGSTAVGSAVTVANAATLGGSGSVAGTIAVSAGGTIAPGTGGTTINTLGTGAVTCNATSVFSVDLNGTGSIADRITSSGTFTCAGTLTVASIINPAAGRIYTIASGATVTGTFSGLANGAVFTQQSRDFQISYTSTTVTLTDVTGVTPSTKTWDGGGSDNNWTTAANWVGDLAPLAGDALVFAGSVRLAPNNNYAAATSFASIAFDNTADLFVIGGNQITLTGDITNNDTQVQTINLAMVIAATRTVNAASGDVVLGGVVSGAGGVTKTGAGTFTVSGINTYGGSTVITQGQLRFNADNNLNGTGPIQLNGGTLMHGGTATLPNALSVTASSTILSDDGDDITFSSATISATVGTQLTLVNSANAGQHTIFISSSGFTYAGNITLDTNSRLVSTNTSGTQVFSGVISGTGTGTDGAFKRDGTGGATTLTGTNTYTGVTTISAGTLQIGNGTTDGSIATSSGITNNAALVYNLIGAQSYGNVISGTGTLTKAGAATLTLSGVNTYTGATTVNAGTLKAGVATQAFGVNSAVTLANVAGATLDITGFSNAIGSLAGGGSTGGAVVLGAATLTCGSTNGDTTYSGIISGTGGVIKVGSGTWTLAGTLANTYSGVTTLADGNLVLQKTDGVSAIAGDITLGDANGTDVLRLGASNQIADTAIITFVSGGGGNSAKFELNGYLETVAGIQSNANQASVIQDTENGGPAGPNTPAILTVTNAADVVYDGLIRNNNGGSGSLGLTKAGAGTLTLRSGFSSTGSNYSGATTLSAGKLVVDNLSAFVSAITNNSTAADALTFNQTTQDLTYAAVISGTGAMSKTGSGTLTLSGTLANTYSGLTTVSAGTLFLNKSSGVNAIPGDLTNAGGTILYGANLLNQIADTAIFTQTGTSSKFNGTGNNANDFALNETMANMVISGGSIFTGLDTPPSTINVTGGITVTGGAGNPSVINNSATLITTPSLSLSGLVSNNEGSSNSFSLSGNHGTAQTRLTVGALSLDGSYLILRKGTSGAPRMGSRLVLDGNVTTTGSSPSFIYFDTGTDGEVEVALASAAGAATRTFTVAGGGADLTINVPIINGAATPGGVTKAGSGTLTLSGANAYTGATTVNAGTLLITGSTHASSAIVVNNTGTLGGSGTVAGTVALSAGATVAPGTDGTTIATLTTGAVTCNGTSVYSLNIDGATADRVTSSGAFACAGTLTIASVANPTVSQTYTIVSGTSVTGTFSGLSNGSTFVQQGRTFQIVYSSTAVTLTDVTGVAATTKTWDGEGGANASLTGWTRAENWVGDVAPLPGDTLVFAGTQKLTNTNDFAAATSFAAITFDNTAGSFDIGGNQITIAGNITNNDDSVQTMNQAMVMAATRTMNAASGNLVFGGVLSGSGGLTKTGNGTVILSTAANTYAGGTTISAGTLQVGTGTVGSENAAALGTGTVTIPTAGTLFFNPGSTGTTYNFTNSFALAGGTIIGGDGNQHLATGGGATFDVGASGGSLQVAWAAKDIYIDGVLTGSGPLAISPYGDTGSESGVWVTNAGNTYSGTVTVTSAATTNIHLLINQPTALQYASLVLVSGGGIPHVWIANNDVTTTLAGLSGNAGVVQGGWTTGAYTLSVNASVNATYGGIVTNGTGGALALTKAGVGALTLAGVNTYTGPTTVSAGTLLVTGSTTASSAVGVSSGATLGGSGTVAGAVTAAAGATVAPGIGGTTIATLNTGAVTCNATSIYTVDIDGATVDRITSSGAFSCAGTLTIASVANPIGNQTYTIASGASVTGTFTGLADGATFTQQGRTFQISYSATTVTLTDATTRTWDGGGADDLWTNALNWTGDVAPVAGDHLVFAGTTRLTPNNDFAANTVFTSITFNAGAGAFVIGGNPLTLEGNVTNNDDSVQTMNQAMIIASTRTMHAASGDLVLGGILSGAGGVIKTGASTLTLTATNTYTGATAVNAGILRAGAATTVFGNNSAVTVANVSGAIFDLNTYNVSIGSLACAGSNGAVDTLAGGTPILTVGGDNSSTTFAGLLNDTAGTLALTKVGTGTLTLSGANTHSGETTITDGIVRITNTAACGTARIRVSGGTLQVRLNGTGNDGTIVLPNSLNLSSGQTGTVDVGNDGTNTGNVVQFPFFHHTNATVNFIGSNGYKVGFGYYRLTGGAIGTAVINPTTTDVIIDGTVRNFTTSHTAEITGTSLGSVIQGAIEDGSGTITILKSGTGTWTLSAANTYSGTTTVSNGTLLITGSTAAASAVTVQSGATLGGSGTVAGTVTLNAGATIAPGTGGTTIAVLNTGATTCHATSVYSVNIDGATADRVTSSGAFACAGTLTIASVANPISTQTYTIASGTSVTGTFTGLADGATFTQQGRTFQITYSATTVTLTDTTTRTWDGGGADDLWTNALNWTGDVAPVAGDHLVFAGTTRLTPNNDFAADTAFSSITFNNTAGAFTISGNRITLAGTIANNDADAQVIALALILNATRTINAASGNVELSGVLIGAGGLDKSGSNTLTLSGTNSYGGNTTVNAGTLRLTTSTSAAGTGLMQIGNGTLSLYRSAATTTYGFSGITSVAGTSGVLTVDGSGANAGTLENSTYVTGTITIDGTLTVQRPTGGNGHTFFSSVLAGSGTLIIENTNGGVAPSSSALGRGRFTNSSNTFSGALQILSGGNFMDSAANHAYASVDIASGGYVTIDGTFTTTVGAFTGAGNVTKNNAANTATLTVGNGDANGDFSGIISQSLLAATGTVALVKTGTGTQTLSGNNTYAGATAVSAGTLLFTGDSSAATGAVSVASGATLGGTGTIGGAVTVASGGVLSPGVSSAATVTLSKASATALTLSAGSTLAMTLGTASDRVTCSGASSDIVLGGTLAVTCGSGFTNTSYVLASGTGTISGSFSSITFSLPGYASTVVLDNVSATRTATLVVTNFAVTARQTIDNDGNGKIDRIRMVTGAAGLNDDFGSITVTVAGYTVTGYNTGAVANDGTFDVLVTELGSADTSATPLVQVTANTSLQSQGTTSYLPVEGSSTAATDTAKPVLLSSLWTDGDANGVDAGDTVTLTFSESVTTTSMAVSDVGLPLSGSGDTLSTTTIGNQSGATISMTLAGMPRLTPGGTYSSAALTAGKPSGVFIANGAAIADAVGLNPVVGNAAVARDLTGSNLLAIAWVSGSNPKTWAVGSIALGATANTTSAVDLALRNVGDSTVDLSILVSVSVPSGWTPAGAAGTDQFLLKVDNAGLPAGDPTDPAAYELTLSTTGQVLVSGLLSGLATDFEFYLRTPTTITAGAGVQQTTTVTITATLPP